MTEFIYYFKVSEQAMSFSITVIRPPDNKIDFFTLFLRVTVGSSGWVGGKARGRLPDERGPERLVEYRVDDRVDRGRHVAQPEAHLGHVVGHRTVGLRAHREHDVQQEERRPAQHEREEHHAQHFARFLFGSHGVGGRQALALLSVGQEPRNERIRW